MKEQENSAERASGIIEHVLKNNCGAFAVVFYPEHVRETKEMRVGEVTTYTYAALVCSNEQKEPLLVSSSVSALNDISPPRLVKLTKQGGQRELMAEIAELIYKESE